jgi:hypothetical protein
MKLVFTMTAGRTGTRSLAGLLAANLPGAHVHHEQLISGPRAVHTPAVPLLLEFNESGDTPRVQRFWAEKAAEIRAQPAHTWVETSHLLMKAGLVENIDQFEGHDVHLVALTRSRGSLLRSYLRLGDFSRVGNRQMWYLAELGRKNLLQIPGAWRQGAMGLALWYLLEVECRVALYRRQLAGRAGVTLHTLAVGDLSGGPRVDGLLEALQTPASPKPPVLPAPHNQGPKRALSPELEAQAEALLAQAADFDPEAYVADLLRRRPRPFAAVRQLTPLGGPDARTGPPEVFIGGAGRSGTTALVDLLSCHPRLSGIYETEFLPTILGRFADRAAPPAELARAVHEAIASWAEPLPHQPHAKRAHERYLHGPHHVLLQREEVLVAAGAFASAVQRGADRWQALRAFTRQVFERHAAIDAKPRWVNKTPNNIMALARLLGLFPDAKVLLMVRDPRDTGVSVLTRPWGPPTLEEVPQWWKACMAPALLLAPVYPDRLRFVRYEDLVCSPENTLAQALEFIGEAPDPEPILSRWRAAGLSFEPGRIGQWRAHFTGADRRAFHAQLEGEMDRFGYGPTL